MFITDNTLRFKHIIFSLFFGEKKFHFCKLKILLSGIILVFCMQWGDGRALGGEGRGGLGVWLGEGVGGGGPVA